MSTTTKFLFFLLAAVTAWMTGIHGEEKSFDELLALPIAECLKNFNEKYTDAIRTCKNEHNDEYLSGASASNKEETIGDVGMLDSVFVFLGSKTKNCVLQRLSTDINFDVFIKECWDGRSTTGIFFDPVPIVTCCLVKVHKFCGDNIPEQNPSS